MKKKLSGLTREHEALFNFVEGNKHICTKKEKQKAEYSSRLSVRCVHPEHWDGKANFSHCPWHRCWTDWPSQQRCRCRWMTSTFKSTWRVIRRGWSWKTPWKTATRWAAGHRGLIHTHLFCTNTWFKALALTSGADWSLVFEFLQILQELEKQRIEVLCDILKRYHLQMTSFGQTLKHVRTDRQRYSNEQKGCKHTFAECRAKDGSNRQSRVWTWKRTCAHWWSKTVSQLKTPELNCWWRIILWVSVSFWEVSLDES